MRALCTALMGLLGCASAPETSGGSDTKPPPLPEHIRADVLKQVQRAPTKVAPELSPPISQGELPWWHGLKSDVYRFKRRDAHHRGRRIQRSSSHR